MKSKESRKIRIIPFEMKRVKVTNERKIVSGNDRKEIYLW